MVFTAMVRAPSSDSPRRIAQANIPKAPMTNKIETRTIRQARNPESSGWLAERGERRIASGSVGSKASVSPKVTAVTMLIHRI